MLDKHEAGLVLRGWALDVDRACALYFWCADHHGGQGCSLYELLSIIGRMYKPGLCERGPNDTAMTHYETLCQEAQCSSTQGYILCHCCGADTLASHCRELCSACQEAGCDGDDCRL